MTKAELFDELTNMDGYICFWNRDKVEVYAETSYGAQQSALAMFQKNTRKKVKSYDIHVVLAEQGGETVSHHPAILG